MVNLTKNLEVQEIRETVAYLGTTSDSRDFNLESLVDQYGKGLSLNISMDWVDYETVEVHAELVRIRPETSEEYQTRTDKEARRAAYELLKKEFE